MSQPLQNYLRTYRRRAGLSQEEVAFLLGCSSAAKSSRYEHSARRPSLETVFIYEVVFDAAAQKLFRGIFKRAEKKTRKRAQILAERLRHAKPNRLNSRKLSILEGIIALRATQPDKHS
jgi:transcriptional regulator with XRE-family HTH domain